MKREKVIIDTDAGIDDAMALFFALESEELDILGITSVFGNTYVKNSTRNILAVLAAAGRHDIQVYEGSGSPIARALAPRSGAFHGDDGLGGVADQLPRPHATASSIPAAQFIAERIMAEPGEITVACLGPVTNLALALRLNPDIAEYAKRIVLLGGAIAIPGNATPIAEANFFNDPESAKIVCGASWNVELVGLNVTTRIEMTAAYVERLCSKKNKATDFIAKTIPFYQRAYASHHGMLDSVYCHDATLIAYLIEPRLFRVEKMPIHVQTEASAAGMTIRDDKHYWSDSSVASVCVEVSGDSVLTLFGQRVGRMNV